MLNTYWLFQDISENAADVSHLKTLHEVGVQSGKGVDYKRNTFLASLLTHDWKVDLYKSLITLSVS